MPAGTLSPPGPLGLGANHFVAFDRNCWRLKVFQPIDGVASAESLMAIGARSAHFAGTSAGQPRQAAPRAPYDALAPSIYICVPAGAARAYTMHGTGTHLGTTDTIYCAVPVTQHLMPWSPAHTQSSRLPLASPRPAVPVLSSRVRSEYIRVVVFLY